MARTSLAVVMLALVHGTSAVAATSSPSVPSAFGGNGHNASFDGRLYIVRTAPGWQVQLLRPEGITYRPDGYPDALGPIWSPPLQIVDGEPNGENALAICEPDATRAPYACDAASSPSATGPFACYDVQILDSDATKSVANGGMVLRRRHLLVRVADPRTASARPVAFTWGALEELRTTANGQLRGIEPTVTRDGRLLLWQGSINNGDQDGMMMYAVAASACAATGWSAPRTIAHMINDPAVNTKYRLAMRQLRAADGMPFADTAPIYGAYPWLLPDGDGVMFSAALMPCRAPEDPGGCGPRRNATSVLGYPTNWGIAHIDGGVNPSTTDDVRLFFSSPGPATFGQLPVGAGHDVWPFFGSNTSNYVEIAFDDGLDGAYAGLWHLNESITPIGTLDVTQSPDVSGYFNTARVRGGITFPGANNGVLGKAAVMTGGWFEVTHDASLVPQNGITMEMTLRPAGDPDCDAANNYRILIRKGDSYSLVLEESRGIRARVRVAGGAIRELYSGAVLTADGATWTKVTAEYDAASGKLQIRFDDQLVAEETFVPAPLAGTTDVLTIGGVGARPACGEGVNFAGTIDEVSISRIARHLAPPTTPGDDAGTNPDAAPTGDGGTDPAATDAGAGGCCDTRRSPNGSVLLVFAVSFALRRGQIRLAQLRRRRDLVADVAAPTTSKLWKSCLSLIRGQQDR
ncbi:MAG: LamG domain-containing protein [Deltaproteobacteria bacterium]|nr:LamG domain-containing protein [Deltaproteobacteria bacterium]